MEERSTDDRVKKLLASLKDETATIAVDLVKEGRPVMAGTLLLAVDRFQDQVAFGSRREKPRTKPAH